VTDEGRGIFPAAPFGEAAATPHLARLILRINIDKMPKSVLKFEGVIFLEPFRTNLLHFISRRGDDTTLAVVRKS